MKKYQNKENEMFYLAEKREIKAIYNSIARAKNISIWPMSCDEPTLTKDVYALHIDKSNCMWVINPETMLLLILKGDVKEI